MPVVVEMYNVGDMNLQRDVVAVVEPVFSDRMGIGESSSSAHRRATDGR
jgi:hypothetical protein